MRSTLVSRLRSNSAPLTSLPPVSTSRDYSSPLAALASRILFHSPLPSSSDNLPIYILNAAAFPDAKEVDYDALLPYVLARLPGEDELLGGLGYEIVFFAGGGGKGGHGKKGRPGLGWFMQAYHVMSRALRKRLAKLWIVHEGGWVRVLVEMFATAVSPKVRKKVVHVSTLSGLALHIPIEDLLIPPSAYVTDRRKEPDIHAPYASGRRAFGVKEPLPRAADGSIRLPRVLRETTSFVLLDPLIKMEGIFRVSARAQTVEFLREAYDRGQKFIVWREVDTVLAFSHYREGTGDVSVGELEHTEGYELHAAAALIKLWYKELREPIFPQSSYQALEKFYGLTEEDLTPSQLLQLLSPGVEYTPIGEISREILIMHLLPLLSRVAESSESNRMTPENLAVCFAVSLLCGPDPIEDIKMSTIIRRILVALIKHWKSDLAPALNCRDELFDQSLRIPESIEDREDPLEELSNAARSPVESQINGITLLDNDESSDEEEGSPPPLPPRPQVLTAIEGQSDIISPVRRKPAPPLHSLPRYSTIVTDRPAALAGIQYYNTVAPEDDEAAGLGEQADALPVYEEGAPNYEEHSSLPAAIHRKPVGEGKSGG